MEQFGLRDIDVFPVVDEHDPQKLLGMISRRDVISAYNRALLKKKMSYA
jgi:CIC family chloride channel protein